jgi:hypothetical protein
MLRGFCRGADPTIFDGDARDDETAKAFCRRCIVKTECLEYALEHRGAVIGVWGGMNDDERSAHSRGGKRRSCPGCRETVIFSDGYSEICVGCGLTWKS